MPQIVATPPLYGLQLGLGTNGAPLKILSGVGDPNASSTDSSAGDIAGCAVGSLYLRQDAPDSTHALYVKTIFVSGAAGTWTAK